MAPKTILRRERSGDESQSQRSEPQPPSADADRSAEVKREPEPRPFTHESRSHHSQPQKKNLEELCDLCNLGMNGATQEEHVAASHPHLVDWVKSYLLQEESLAQQRVNLSDSVLEELGKLVINAAQDCDGGPEMFQFALNAMDQLDLVTKRQYDGCQTFMFGSCIALGVWDGAADVDMTMVDAAKWQERRWPPEDEGGVIMKVARLLRDAGFAYEDLEPVKFTRVPICKHKSTIKDEKYRVESDSSRDVVFQFRYVDTQASVERMILLGGEGREFSWENRSRLRVHCPSTTDAVACHVDRIRFGRGTDLEYKTYADRSARPEMFYIDFDLSTRAFGVRNSYLLRRYLSDHLLARAGSVWIKKWSKYSGVNNSRKGFLTSYAINIMWIYYLLRTEKVKYFNVEEIPVLPDQATIHSLRYQPMIPEGSEPHKLASDLGRLVAGFFAFYALEFDWENDVVSLKAPGSRPVHKSDLNWIPGNGPVAGGTEVSSALFRERVWYRFCIDDPYEANLNLGRHLSPLKANKLRAEFLFAFGSLVRGRLDLLTADRSSDAVSLALEKSLVRRMIGREEMPVSESLAELLADDRTRAILSSFECENKVTKLFSLCDFVFKAVGTSRRFPDEETITWGRDARMIPAEYRKELLDFEEKCRRAKDVGEPLPAGLPEEYVRLPMFFKDEASELFFVEPGHRDSFKQHVRLASLILRDNRKNSMAVQTLHERAKSTGHQRYKPGTLDSALRHCRLLFYVDGKRVSLRASNSRIGTCDGCFKPNRLIWPDEDDGGREMYCEECWADWNRKLDEDRRDRR